jgi:hypothetical protein
MGMVDLSQYIRRILVVGEIDIVETRGNVNYTFGNVTSAGSTLQWGPSMDLNAYMDTHVEVLVDNGKSFADNFHTWGEYDSNKQSGVKYVLKDPLNRIGMERRRFENLRR